MAKDKTASKTDSGASSPKKSGPSALVLLISSFAIVLTGMMFATGAAQKAALPRLREFAATLPFVKKPPSEAAALADSAGTASAASADAAGAATPRAPWSAAADSVALLEQQLEIALAEIDETAAGAPGDEASGTGTANEVAGGTDAGLDEDALRDLARLVKVLDAMKPADAARILDSVDDDLAVEAIRKLKERQAGKVLALMNPTKAITVGEMLGRGAGGGL